MFCIYVLSFPENMFEFFKQNIFCAAYPSDLVIGLVAAVVLLLVAVVAMATAFYFYARRHRVGRRPWRDEIIRFFSFFNQKYVGFIILYACRMSDILAAANESNNNNGSSSNGNNNNATVTTGAGDR